MPERMRRACYHFTGKLAGCPAFLPVGRGGEGGNGLPQWSQSRPCNGFYISRKSRPVGGELHWALYADSELYSPFYPPGQKATPACRNAFLPTGRHFGVQTRSGLAVDECREGTPRSFEGAQ